MKEEKKYNPSFGKGFGALVYIGVVLAATTLFISMVLSAFPEDAYFSRVVMTIAGFLVGLSMLAFPVALHTWAITGKHHTITAVLYYVEMVFIAVNTVVSFLTLLGRNTGYDVPEWAQLYEPFSVAAIVYTLAAWGTVFLTDPEHKRIQRSRDADEKFEDALSNKLIEFVDSAEGEDLIIEIATARASERYSLDRYTSGKKHFGTKANGSIPAPAPFVKKEAASPSPLPESDGD